MKKSGKILLAVTMVAVLSASGISSVLADEENGTGNDVRTCATSTCITQTMNIEHDGKYAGWDPGQKLQPRLTQTIYIDGSKDEEYRISSTSMWVDGDYVYGGHQSESTLNEDQIWADGAIKRSGQGWADMDNNRTSGFIAYCDTSMLNPAGIQTFIAHSWHYYNDSLGGELSQQSDISDYNV